jgi:hypothetical protein
MQNSFNADFYVVAATIIPVFYLALSLQGSTLTNTLARWRRAYEDFTQESYQNRQRSVRGMAVSLLTSGIIIGSMIAEYMAILALYDRSDDGITGPFVFYSLLGLLIVAVGGPLGNFSEVYFGMFLQVFRMMSGTAGNKVPEEGSGEASSTHGCERHTGQDEHDAGEDHKGHLLAKDKDAKDDGNQGKQVGNS